MNSSTARAPHYTRNARWIAENVHDHFNYIQLDRDAVRLDRLEWGVTTQDFWNLWRLTPSVYCEESSEHWTVKAGVFHYKTDEDTARYCLDRAAHLIASKQQHFALAIYLDPRTNWVTIAILEDAPLLARPEADAPVIETIEKGRQLQGTEMMVSDRGIDYVHVFEMDADTVIDGYVPQAYYAVIEDEETSEDTKAV